MSAWTAAAGMLKQPNIPLPALLGLNERAPGPKQPNKYFFASPLISQRLAMLRNMVGSRSMVIVVVGERGSGKTTLMNQFITDERSRWHEGRIRLKQRRKVPAGVWHNLNNRLVFLSKKDSPPSVIIDDAHQLSSDELKLLLQSAWAADGTRKLQSIVLFAEPQMRTRFAEIARWLPPKSVIDKIFMTPLTEKQTAEYLQHRLKVAGFLKKIPFSPEQIKSIYRHSGGLPGWINGEAFMVLKKIYTGKRSSYGSILRRLRASFEWKSLFLGKRLFFARN